MDLKLENNSLTKRHPIIAPTAIEFPKQGRQTEENMSTDLRLSLREGSAGVTITARVSINSFAHIFWVAVAKKIRHKGEFEPKTQKQDIKTTDKIAKEAQELLDLFQ